MDGRNEKGQFTVGNTASQGRKIDRLKAEMQAAVSEDDIRDIVEALVTRAREGDVKAATLLFDRLFGRPHQSRETQPMVFDDNGGEIVFDDGGETTENKIEWDWGDFEQKQKERYEQDVNARAEQLIAERAKQGA